MKIKIVGITVWEKDNRLIDGDASHEGVEAVRKQIAEEEEIKIYGEWTKGLPFECEAESIEDAIEQYNEAHCEWDYLKAADCEVEE